MPLSWNEIRNRAYTFVKEWEGETREHAEAKSFYDDFFNVFGVRRRRVASFEKHVKVEENDGFIDLLWKGVILIEHKSKGKDLDRAHEQAKDYFGGLKDEDLPKHILVSDFDRFRLFDMDDGGREVATFSLKELPENLTHFGFIAGYEVSDVKPEDPVNIEAAEKMGVLHDELKEAGYTEHALQVYLVRLLFCLFAEDTGIFHKALFSDLLRLHTREDGSDLGAILHQLFEVLNTPKERRATNLVDHLNEFPYINGALFEEVLPTASFDSRMSKLLLDATSLSWSRISPAIFGSLFQSVMNPVERRNLGAHYTSEANILKVIEPLFLDDLKQEFQRAKGNKAELKRFQQKLASLKFLDPACGGGNFLVISYRELRVLELEVLKEIHKGQRVLDIGSIIEVNVDQFYGIEIEEFPAQIAQVAMWLVDHQMNLMASEAFGQYFVRLPLKKSPTIVQGNALQVSWEEVVSKSELNYILGNPPFIGKQYQDQDQKSDLKRVFKGVKGARVLDYVAAWYLLAAHYIRNTNIKVAFVSTNSISQGEQVPVLWKELTENYEVEIFFAHRTFKWTNEARGKAAVHCVIIGFSSNKTSKKRLFDYETSTSQPHEINASGITAYLTPGASDTFVVRRRKPISNVSPIVFGSMPNDGGYLLIKTEEEKDDLLQEEPMAEKYIRLCLGSEEFINNKKRWCLWLVGINPSELRSMPHVMERVAKVKETREKSKRATTRRLASTPMLFGEIRQPQARYLAVPEVSSQARKYIPSGFLANDVIATNKLYTIENASLFEFGIISSIMHMSWIRHVAGRLKSDYQYSAGIVYNNFPFPQEVKDRQKTIVEHAAQNILDVREKYSTSSLADLYDPVSMPPDLAKGHADLDKAVDLCYRPQPFTTELNRMEFLFDLYRALVS